MHGFLRQKYNIEQSFYKQLLTVVLFNTAIAVLLSLLIKEARFADSFFISQCIGLSIFLSFNLIGHYYELSGWKIVIPLSVGSMVGVLGGVVMPGMIKGVSKPTIFALLYDNSDKVLVNLFLAFFFGSIITYYFISRERQLRADKELQTVLIKNLDQEKQIAETQLQLLQAQIEPHFLFNSLSNVISLIETDPSGAKLMLERLSRYLRAGLVRSQEQAGTLQDELNLIENYLGVIQIRMGSRLSYTISAPDELLKLPFPIMLLQPLVENAIHHGLEPLADGGEICVRVQKQHGVLSVSVQDNGVGLHGDSLSGFGLYNVRQRLISLYGSEGILKMENNTGQGACVSIEIPYA